MTISYFSLAIGIWILFVISKKMEDYFLNRLNSKKERVSRFSIAGWFIVGFGVFEAVSSDFFATMGPIEGMMFIIMLNFGAVPIIGLTMYLGSLNKDSSCSRTH